MNTENLRRAPYYLEDARKKYEKGLRQRNGIDKSNEDPFIALYDAQHQVLGALDLAPGNASVWLGAGQVTAMIASLDEDKTTKREQAMRMLARACAMDGSNVGKILEWASARTEGEDGDFAKMKRSIGRTVTKWKGGKVPRKLSTADFLPFLAEREDSEVCTQGAAMDPVDASPAKTADRGDQVKAAVASMSVRPLFPTLITTVNVGRYFGADFSDKLATMAIKKYQDFSAQRKRRGQTDPNDINDGFFSAQATGDGLHRTPQAQAFWSELYNSEEYEQLRHFLREALLEHASKTGYPISEEYKKRARVVLWAAVYLSDGGRHGYHVHQSSLSSCVFYARAPPGKTPIMFVDPRGAPPTHDYEQHIGEHDFEPVAPFHHNYHFFAEAGDLVCFPSWLVHRVPSHFEQEPRVAFPANLEGQGWDPWYRSATLA
uniref:Uncharacterized protein n=1 Tax=Pyrodinium bahamense TaxID=73915 RepID=A0A7S0AKS0_9DINO|mmetsp:Transcript_36857/g.102280  ORF Transcript_36857/g.102280 Transcript_36857/m.102280 type:complete len:432 (+) Transcript_36857:101-1396(+)